MRRLPPLAAVRAFEAAARHLSFTAAARELGMTQAAISYQIKLLEERVGAPLFLRLPRQVQLTEAGRRLAPPVIKAFDALRDAFEPAAEEALVITSVHTFATNWLAPRLGVFQASHPGIAVRLSVSPHLVDFAREEVDVAIRSGDGRWPGLVAHRLLPVEYTAVCSLALLERTGGAIARMPLIGREDPWWDRWLDAAGFAGAQGPPGPSLGSQQLEGAAAMRGEGLAFVTPAFFAEEFASGRLVRPLPVTVREDAAYWLAYSASRRLSRKIQVFRDWLLREMERSTAAIPDASDQEHPASSLRA